jgi:hypothetical protein
MGVAGKKRLALLCLSPSIECDSILGHQSPKITCEINVCNLREMKSDLERSIRASFIAKERAQTN